MSSNRLALMPMVIVLFLSGCSAQKLYSDGASEEEAYLETRNASIVTVDGHSASIFSARYAILSGEHTLDGKAAREGYFGPYDADVVHTIKFRVAPGRLYYLKGSSSFGQCIWVEDAETGNVVSVDEKGCGIRGRKASDHL